jgi:hypothetical protein
MTGKEALKYIKGNTRYRYVGWNNSHIEAVEKDIDELTKYKKAFEILKDKGIFEFKDYTNMIFLQPEDYIWNGDIIEEMFINVNDEEYELLEELMRDA